jgi:hypothetical protein
MIATSATEDAPQTPAAPHEGRAEDQPRLARAEVARLTLELRAVTRKAEIVEQTRAGSEPHGDEAADVDIAGARELVASTLAQRLDARRSELAAELEDARAEAARLVESAHQRAEEYVARAHDVVLAALLHPDEPVEPLPPLPLEAVPDAHPPTPPEVGEEPTLVVPALDGTTGFAAMVAAVQAYLTQGAVAAPSAASSRTAGAQRPRQPLRTRVLHVDVILPLIAVVAVLLILIAWVG